MLVSSHLTGTVTSISCETRHDYPTNPSGEHKSNKPVVEDQSIDRFRTVSIAGPPLIAVDRRKVPVESGRQKDTKGC